MKRKHIHKYRRKDIGAKNGPGRRNKFIVFACTLPDCNHYVEKALVEGKFCLCNRCGQIMTMTKVAMDLALPHCFDCTKRKKPLVDLTKLFEDKEIE